MDAPGENDVAPPAISDPLQARAAAADRPDLAPPAAAPGAAEPGAAAGELVNEEELWVNAALRWGAILRAMVPERARPHWTEERLREVGKALAGAAKHYGWRPGFIGHPLALLAGAVAPLVWPIAEPYVIAQLKRPAKPADPGDAKPEPPPPAPVDSSGASSLTAPMH